MSHNYGPVDACTRKHDWPRSGHKDRRRCIRKNVSTGKMSCATWRHTKPKYLWEISQKAKQLTDFARVVMSSIHVDIVELQVDRCN